MISVLFILYHLLLYITSFVSRVHPQYSDPAICISKCVCLRTEGVVACHESDQLTALPTNIHQTYTQLILQIGKFDFPIIYSYNLTGLEHLTFFKIVYYNLEVIAPRAFYRMKQLKHLDLSHNKLLTVSDHAFSGLSLTALHLMENPNVKFEPRAFVSMQAMKINLRSNNMTILDYNLFKNTKVTNLYLYNNSISRIDPKFQELFNSTNTLLDVSNNPLICDCSLSWLAESLAIQLSKPRSFNEKKQINIACDKPENLHNRELMFLQPNELKCLHLKIDEIKVNVSFELYEIACVSKIGGYKTPSVSWQHYVDDSRKKVIDGLTSHHRILEEDFQIISLSTNTIQLPTTYFQDGFLKLICIASVDDNPIQTLEVNINKFIPRIVTPKLNKTQILDTSRSSRWFMKNYTLLELLCAIFGTFCFTFVILLLFIRCRRTYQNKLIRKDKESEKFKHSNIIKPYWYSTNGHSSTYSVPNSNLEYDLPVSVVPRNEMMSFYPNNNSNRQEFIDYKTHNPIIK